MVDFAIETTEGKNISDSYPSLYERYPEVGVWCDSLKRTDALRDTFIVDEDGNRLHALYASAPEPTPNTAVIIHGFTNSSITVLYQGYMFNKKLKYNILLPDLYAHGLSDGEEVQMGLKDADDLMLWTDVADGIFGNGHHTKMVVHGTSMGAATAMILSGKENKPFIKCYVEDSGYTSAWDEYKYQLGDMFGLPWFPLLNTCSLLCDIKYGWSFHEASPEEYVKKCSKPMLFIHSDNDTFVPSWMVHPLYEAKPGQKELWIVPGSPHTMAYHDYPEVYTEKVAAFLNRYGM